MRYHTCRLESRCSPVPLFARMKVLVVDSSASFEAEAHLFGRLARKRNACHRYVADRRGSGDGSRNRAVRRAAIGRVLT